MRDLKKAKTSGHVFKRIHKGSGPARLIDQILEKANTNSGKSVQTLGTLVHGWKMGLSLSCQDCGHAWRPDTQALLESLGEDAPLTAVQQPCPVCASAHVHAHPVAL